MLNSSALSGSSAAGPYGRFRPAFQDGHGNDNVFICTWLPYTVPRLERPSGAARRCSPEPAIFQK
jgi:hypothetical protein